MTSRCSGDFGIWDPSPFTSLESTLKQKNRLESFSFKMSDYNETNDPNGIIIKKIIERITQLRHLELDV